MTGISATPRPRGEAAPHLSVAGEDVGRLTLRLTLPRLLRVHEAAFGTIFPCLAGDGNVRLLG